MGSCAAPSAKGDDKFITTDYLQQCQAVYQLSGKGIVEHSRSAFADLEAKGDQIVAGRTYTVGYVNGKGTARPGQAASLAQQQQRSASKGGGISL
ncbi:hypothetical protein [Klebsiella pneumoniae]|uniref:hypothetical protein n=1 Tax=Klebsiella pneumoniae TaxID=573 RepID=UPI001F4DC2F1|nr:hypothetical protein [Klebsiella pneumoniae]